MSRYDFAGTKPDIRVSIGWDRPLRTFFVQIVNTASENDDTVEDQRDPVELWLGTTHSEIPYAADAIRIANAHAELPPDIGRTLEMDRLRTSAEQGGPAQQAARPFLTDK